MKKTLFLLTLMSNFIFAQNPDLFSNDWYISQIVINNQTITAPVMQLPIGESFFQNAGGVYNFNSKYYNTAGFSLTFNTLTDSFTKLGGSCTLAVYNGTNAATAQAFDGSNCNFYLDSTGGSIYNYQIINNGSSKTLIITNPQLETKFITIIIMFI